MAKAYLEKLSELTKKAAPGIEDINLEVKHFFGGAAVYADGKIFMTLTPVGLAIKLPENIREKLISKKEARKLRYFPKAPIKKEYALLSRKLAKETKKIRHYMKISIAYVT